MDKIKTTHRFDWTRRPVFRDPERYSPERFNRISEYHTGRLRHALLGIAGSGIIYGFDIETDTNRCCHVKKGAINIGCGLAIDECGRILFWPGGWVGIDRLAGNTPEGTGAYTLFVHYAERPSNFENHCGCDKDDAAWIEEGVVFSLQEKCQSSCEDCPEHCNHCVSTDSYVCGRTGSDDNGIPMAKELAGICKDPGELCHVGCGDWLYDFDSGLPLACVELCHPDSGGKYPGGEGCGTAIEFCCTEPVVCTQRNYVYRNPLLYELIKGCHYDLAHIAELNFHQLLRSDWDDAVPFVEFAKCLRDGLTVTFTKPIMKSTLTPASVFVTAIVREQDSFFQDVLRLPTESFTYSGERDGFVDGVTLNVPEPWIRNQLESELSRFNYGAIIEYTVRCAMLRDECGCMPDARPLDMGNDCLEKCPTDKPAQQMPGNDFVVAFCIDRIRVASSKGDDDKKEQAY